MALNLGKGRQPTHDVQDDLSYYYDGKFKLPNDPKFDKLTEPQKKVLRDSQGYKLWLFDNAVRRFAHAVMRLGNIQRKK